MQTKKKKLGLVPKLIIAIVLGVLIGQFLPESICRLVVTLSGFFSNFLKFVIPLMILAYVTMGIADLTQGAGKLLLITVGLAYGSTLIAGSASYLVSSNLFPHFMSADAMEQIAALETQLRTCLDMLSQIRGEHTAEVVEASVQEEPSAEDQAADEISQNLEALVGTTVDTAPKAEPKHPVGETTTKFANLQFGRNYDPNK